MSCVDSPQVVTEMVQEEQCGTEEECEEVQGEDCSEAETVCDTVETEECFTPSCQSAVY